MLTPAPAEQTLMNSRRSTLSAGAGVLHAGVLHSGCEHRFHLAAKPRGVGVDGRNVRPRDRLALGDRACERDAGRDGEEIK